MHNTYSGRLEQGELIVYPICPFPLPTADDLAFLRAQNLSCFHKNIDFDPVRDRIVGAAARSGATGDRLTRILRDFGDNASTWLATLTPNYADAWLRDRVTFRPEEEAVRRLRQTARNDVLHLDAFPSRPSQGHRILRLFVNVHETDARVWATSQTFPKILERFGATVGLPGPHAEWSERLARGFLGIFQPGAERRSSYDSFMLRLHHFLKANDEFQERSPRKLWQFPPGSCWLAFTDMVSYAELRGRFALEHSFFVSPKAMVRPDLSPPNLLDAAVRGERPRVYEGAA